MGAATSPAYRQVEASPAVDPFEAKLREIARQLRETIPNLTDRETEFLHDMARVECRYPMPTVRKLCALSRRSRNPAVRAAFAELIRNECLVASDDLSVTGMFGLEMRTTGPTDIAQRDFERDKNPITYAKVKAALEQQIASTELALLAVVRWGARNGCV